MINTSVKKEQRQSIGLGVGQRLKFGGNDKMRRMTQIGTASSSGNVMFTQPSNLSLKDANGEPKTFKR